MCPLMILPPAASAVASTALATEQLTVRELMRLDAELALEAARRKRGQGAESRSGGVIPSRITSEASAQQDALRLVGIYGVGKRLFAEVRLGERGLLFVSGQPFPVGHQNDRHGYRLKKLAGRCIELEHQSEETQLCLSSGRQ